MLIEEQVKKVILQLYIEGNQDVVRIQETEEDDIKLTMDLRSDLGFDNDSITKILVEIENSLRIFILDKVRELFLLKECITVLDLINLVS